jgi:NIPSNAP protein
MARQTLHGRTAMFIEQRIYSFAPGNTGEFLKTYESEAMSAQTSALGQPIGYYVNEIGPLNQVTTMWAYGSLDERVERRGKLFADPVWQTFLKKCRPMMTAQETRVLIPAPFFRERLKAIAALGKAS